jgi:hypothetical protein
MPHGARATPATSRSSADSVTLGATTLDIVGILPEGFIFPSARANPSVVTLGKPLVRSAKGRTFYPVVRVAPGVSRDAAQAEIEAATAMTSVSLGQPKSVPALNDVRAILYPVGQPIMRYLAGGGRPDSDPRMREPREHDARPRPARIARDSGPPGARTQPHSIDSPDAV